MQILMLSATFPYPPDRGGTEVRTFNLLKHLHAHHQVTLVTQDSNTVSQADVAALKRWVHDLWLFPPPAAAPPTHPWAKLRRLAIAGLTGIPPHVRYRYSPELQARLDEAVATHPFDVLTCEHSVWEIYVSPQLRSSLRVVLNAHSCISAWTRQRSQQPSQSPLETWRDRLYLPLLRRYERTYCRKFSHIVVTTEDDRQEFLQLSPDASITVIPNGVDLALFPPRPYDPGGTRLVFVGAMDAFHNMDAAGYLALEILPRLQARYPTATLRIVGTRPAATVQALADRPGVEVTGTVHSVAQELHQATVCVLPLRMGLGIKNKTLEAMAVGVPVVGSDRALEGIQVDGDSTPRRALRANTTEEYLGAIAQLFENPDLRRQLGERSRQWIAQHYTWQQMGTAYEQVLQGRQKSIRIRTED